MFRGLAGKGALKAVQRCKSEQSSCAKVQRCDSIFRSRVSAVGSQVQVFRYRYRFRT